MSTFIVPRVIYYGLNTIENLKDLKNKKKAIIVTGKGAMKKTGILDRIETMLKENGIVSAVIEGVEEDPSIDTVMKGVQVFNKEKPDVIIGLGGCSAIDAAKVMWYFYEYPEAKFEDIITPFSMKPLRNKAIFVAIPSTSGTGTEVTCAAVITDHNHIKHPIISYEITPDIAIVDGDICKTMPPHVTANTGMDAMTHSVEAFVSVMAAPYTDPLALKSILLIFENLPIVYKEGGNLTARQAVHDASCLAGMAFTNALLGIAHAMAHQLGGMFGMPHGRANALLLANVIRFNSKKTDKYNLLAKHLGKKTAEDFALAIEALNAKVGIENSIKAYGIKESLWNEKLDTITAQAIADPCVGANPRQPTAEEIKKIFAYTYAGRKVDF